MSYRPLAHRINSSQASVHDDAPPLRIELPERLFWYRITASLESEPGKRPRLALSTDCTLEL